MSLILDALRKSEHQRQRDGGPGLSVVPEGSAARRPGPWTLALAGLLLLNLLVLAGVLLFDRAEPDPAITPPPVTSIERASSGDQARSPAARSVLPAATQPAAKPAENTLRSAPVTLPARPPRNEVRSLTTEAAVGTRPAARGAEPSPAAPSAGVDAEVDTGAVAGPGAGPGAGSGGAGATASGGARGTQRSTQQANDDARLPRFADLVVRGELAVPNMHIDIHVYSAVADERFVFINMRRYNEGQRTQEGPQVERIVPDGVVMEHQGQRFFMSRD